MIHRALAGSMERFFGVLIEHFGGNFPAWLAPVQAVVDADLRASARLRARGRGEAARGAGLRVDVDESNEKLGYKIRHWKTQKVPYILVVGKSEAADGTVNVNERGNENKRTRAGRGVCRRTARARGRAPLDAHGRRALAPV